MWSQDQEQTLKDGLSTLVTASAAPNSASGASICFLPHLREVYNLRTTAFLGKVRSHLLLLQTELTDRGMKAKRNNKPSSLS